VLHGVYLSSTKKVENNTKIILDSKKSITFTFVPFPLCWNIIGVKIYHENFGLVCSWHHEVQYWDLIT
jgi:hypothetical protein